ncbi:glycosyltransferase family 32 protein [Aulographum hederae CBS 113979]|uniref:Glycosyltransferase family 32 protein n=1 Tax=Aulographum hederae CBS 113979 TaxID=1176131 RepID=A0A6G1GR41_9PEZI|nr:glycosyltransferase family 32 protein [Aulographum hederae CBS 113979]
MHHHYSYLKKGSPPIQPFAPAKCPLLSRTAKNILLLFAVILMVSLTRLYNNTDVYSEALTHLAQRRLRELNADYNPYGNKEEWNLDIGSPSAIDLKTYSETLLSSAKDVLSRKHHLGISGALQDALEDTLDALNLHAHGDFERYEERDIGPSLGRRLVVAQKNYSELFKQTPQFESWPKQNPDWFFDFYDDERMDAWLRDYASGSKLQDVFHALPRDVMRSDVFRYLALFEGGGLYTDSDTSSIKPISTWDSPTSHTTDLTDPTLSHVTAQLRRHHNPLDPCPSVSHCAPRLIVAIESDPLLWHDLHYCGFQVSQYTFGASAGHPVLLDALTRIVAVFPAIAADPSSSTDDRKVFEYTGPQMWANAVWRYLLARWGFDFRKLAGMTRPVRVGDVLILPFGSFAAGFSELDVEQGSEARVWHGAWGRWRKQARPG